MRKNTLIGALMLLGCAATASATLAPACPGSATDSGPVSLAVFSDPAFSCQQQDKAYSNFVVSGLPAQTSLRFFYQPVPNFDFHTVTFTGNFENPFTVSYTVTLDTSVSPGAYIDRVSGDLQNPALIGDPTSVKTVQALVGTGSGTVTSKTGSAGTPLFVNGTSFRITDTYTPNGGAATAVGNAFREVLAPVPEPGTLALAGLAFLGVGMWRRSVRK